MLYGRLTGELFGRGRAGVAAQIPLSRLMVEDIQTRKDAEGGMPQDIFAAAQEEVGVDWGQSKPLAGFLAAALETPAATAPLAMSWLAGLLVS